MSSRQTPGCSRSRREYGQHRTGPASWGDEQSQDKLGKSLLLEQVVVVVELHVFVMAQMLGEVVAVVLGLELSTDVGFFLKLLAVSVMPREIL